MLITRRCLTVAACGILALAAFFPQFDLPVVSNADAQNGPPTSRRTMKKGELYKALSRAKIKMILAEPIPDIKIPQMPLREVLAELKNLTGINIYFEQEELGDVIDPDVPIDLDLAEHSMTYKTLIDEFILGPNLLVIVIQDNFLRVMSYDKSLTEYEIVVYNCRDLLVGNPVQPTAREDDLGDGAYDAVGGLGSPGGASAMVSDLAARERQLIEAIYSTLRSEDAPWDDETSSCYDENVDVGSIAAINGLLVIRQTQAVHDQVEQLLELLRNATQERN